MTNTLKTITLDIALDEPGYTDDDIAHLLPDLERDLAREIREMERRLRRRYDVRVDETMTTEQVAEELGVSRRRALALIGSGQLKASKFGKAWRVKRGDLGAVRDRKTGRPGRRREKER